MLSDYVGHTAEVFRVELDVQIYFELPFCGACAWGQCFRQPTLGCREFSARGIRLVDKVPTGDISHELDGDIDLGYMLYGMNFGNSRLSEGGSRDDPSFLRQG